MVAQALVALVVAPVVLAQVAALGVTANSPAGRSRSPLSRLPAMIGLDRTNSKVLVGFLVRDLSIHRRSSARMIPRSIPAAPPTACSRQAAAVPVAVAPVAVALAAAALAAAAPVAAAPVAAAPVAAAPVAAAPVEAASLEAAQAAAAPVAAAPVAAGPGSSPATKSLQTRIRNVCPNLAVSLSSPLASPDCTSPDVATPADARVRALSYK